MPPTLSIGSLRAEGFAVDVCHDGDDALHLATTVPYDALVLDIMLPGRDGLNAGADDYLPKPFALAELVARVRAMGRRAGEGRATVLQVADLALSDKLGIFRLLGDNSNEGMKSFPTLAYYPASFHSADFM